MSGESTKAWIAGDLVIDRAVLADIEAHAVECYPKESCGLVFGPADAPLSLDESRREENLADKYHKLDPVQFPRTGETYFKLHEKRAMDAIEQGEANGRPLKVIYHSHCDAGAYFSAEDSQTFAYKGQLMWPCAFLVVSVVDGMVRDRKLWVHTPGTDAFHESRITIS